MQCPFCDAKMEKGFIQSSHRIIWSTDMKGLTIAWPNRKKGEMFLNTPRGAWGGYIESYLCRSCKKLIADCYAE